MKNPRFLSALLLCPVLACVMYAGFWVWLAGRIDLGARDFILGLQKRPDAGVVVRDLGVSGFPWAPVLRFSGSVRDTATIVHIPVLTLRGFFLPGTSLEVEIPQGYAIHTTRSIAFQNLLLAQVVRIRFVIPPQIPGELSERAMRAWQRQGNAVVLEDITIVRDDGLAIMGAGGIGFDDGLQPDIRLRLSVLRPDLLIRDLADGKLLSGGQETLARAVVGALTKEDGILHTDLSVRNGGVFLGPVRVGACPRLAWVPESFPDTHNSPALPQ